MKKAYLYLENGQVLEGHSFGAAGTAMGELVWHGVDINTGSVRAVGTKIVFSGTVRMSVLYEAAETGELASGSFETEFSQMIDTATDLSSPDCSIYSMLTAEYVEPTTLSGGETQRVLLALALEPIPQILILDEPFNGLDQDGITNIHALLQTLKEQGKCILLASHSVTDIAQACDVVYAFHQGRLENAKACNSTTVMDRKIV